MKDFDLIIFDCDGTLTDSEYANNQAMLDVLQDLGFPGYDLDHAYKHWLGTTVPGIILSIQADTGRKMPDDFFSRYMARVSEMHQTALKPVDGAKDLVAFARKHYKICVASNGERSNVIASLEQTGLMDFFTPGSVFTKMQVKNPKPYPDLFLFAAAQMGAEPDRCLVLEDSTTGVRAGVAANMTTWGFTGTSHSPEKQREALQAAGAHKIYTGLIHIYDDLSH